MEGETATRSISLSTGSNTLDWGLGSGPAYDADVSATEVTQTEDPSLSVDGTTVASYSGTLADGETVTRSFSALSPGSHDLSTSASGGVDHSASWTEHTVTEDPAVDVDGDGSAELSHSGLLADGDSVSQEVDLSTDDDTVSVSTSGGSTTTVRVKLQERSNSANPGVVVNGQKRTVGRDLADGETETLDLDESLLQEENNVTVVMGSTSADAPAPRVDFAYSHTASSSRNVSTSEGEWREVYEVNKTFATNVSNASFLLPFGEDVVRFKSVEYRVENSSWTSLSPSSWSTTNTTLRAELGDAAKGETVAVKARAQKVDVQNGAIQVTEPTTPGQALNTEFVVESHADGFGIATEGTRVLDVRAPSWDSPSPSSVIEADGDQTLLLPNAAAGSTARVSQSPLVADPATGDVEVALEQTSSPPRFSVSPGSTIGDSVTFRWRDTTGGMTYSLYSLTEETAKASATSGGGPVDLPDDDSGETFQISSDANAGAQTGTLLGGGSLADTLLSLLRGGGFVAIALVSVVGLFLAGSWAGRESDSLGEEQTGFGLAGLGVIIAVPILLETLNPGSISSRIGQAASEALSSALGPSLVLGIIAVMVLGWGFFKSRKDETTIKIEGEKK
ncbi:hypothetical protein [Halocalculus aciditolerans]|nr:hypothetical protein [Halocalculus aciditolerans]